MYAAKRSVPPANICSIRASTAETVTRQQYTESIEQTIAQCLKSRGLIQQIFYIVLTQDVPLRIASSPGHGSAQAADGASVDSELVLLPRRMRGEKMSLPGPAENPFFRQREVPFSSAAFQMYLVTRLAAYRYETVERMVEQSLQARRQGKFVLDLRSDDDHEGNSWLRTAAVLLPRDRVVIDESSMVITNVKDAIGYAAWGSNDKNRTARFLNFRWFPGAIASDFVSSNGRTFQKPPDTWTLGSWSLAKTWFQGSPQSLSADYLHEGATGASGHVDEPFLAYCPRPEILFPAYWSGRNLAESYWMSIPATSWMNIVIGDPLCRLQ
jgi:uncharacterized protein (TIGR03790 family)